MDQKLFFYIFFVREKNSQKMNNNKILDTYAFLKNKNINDICYSQFLQLKKFLKKKFHLGVFL